MKTLVCLMLPAAVWSCADHHSQADASVGAGALCADRALSDCDEDGQCSVLEGAPVDRTARCLMAPSAPAACVPRFEVCAAVVACAEDEVGALWAFGVGCNLDQSPKFTVLRNGDCYGPPCPTTTTSTDASTNRYEDDAGTLHTYDAVTGQCVTDLVCTTPAACMEESSEEIQRKCADGWTVVDAPYGSGFKRYQGKCDVHFSEYYNTSGRVVARTHPGSYCSSKSTELTEGDAALLWSLRGVPWAKGAQDACAKFRDSGLSWIDAGAGSCR